MSPRTRTPNGDIQLSMDESVRLLAMDLERAYRHDQSVLDVAVFRAEATRARAERLLEGQLTEAGLRVQRVRVKPDDDTRDLPLYLHWNPPPNDAVVLIYDLRRGFPATLQYLNYRREFLVEDRIKAVFWVLEDEARRLALEAPDFWAFRGQVVEFLEVPPPTEMAALAAELAWWGYQERLSEEERQARIALRERLLADLPDDETSLAARAELLYTLGGLRSFGREYTAAEVALSEALTLVEQMDDARRQAWMHNSLGNVYKNQNRLDEALVEYQQAIALDPAFAIPHSGLGNVYADLGRLDEALAAYQQAITLDPAHAGPYNNLGLLYAAQGRLDEAIAEYQRAIALNPTFALPHTNLGTAYAVQGRLNKAIAEYQQAIELDPVAAWPHFNWALLEVDRGDMEVALTHLQDAIARDPQVRQWARTAPEFAPLREDPRFRALVEPSPASP